MSKPRQQVLPGLPADLAEAAQKLADRQERLANRCLCHSTHEAREPCVCDCHVDADGNNARLDRQMRRDWP